MKTTIGVYDSHHDAVEAVKELQAAGYNSKKMSIVGRAADVQDIEGVKTSQNMAVAGAEVGIGAVAGSVLGVLTGIGIFAIPGLGFLYGAGALVGAIAGFDFGIIGGGIASALTVAGLSAGDTEKYEESLKSGKVLLIVQGSEEEVSRARDILQNHGKSINIHAH